MVYFRGVISCLCMLSQFDYSINCLYFFATNVYQGKVCFPAGMSRKIVLRHNNQNNRDIRA